MTSDINSSQFFWHDLVAAGGVDGAEQVATALEPVEVFGYPRREQVVVADPRVRYVRRYQDVVAAPERMTVRERLGSGDVEAGAADDPCANSFEE